MGNQLPACSGAETTPLQSLPAGPASQMVVGGVSAPARPCMGFGRVGVGEICLGLKGSGLNGGPEW